MLFCKWKRKGHLDDARCETERRWFSTVDNHSSSDSWVVFLSSLMEGVLMPLMFASTPRSLRTRHWQSPLAVCSSEAVPARSASQLHCWPMLGCKWHCHPWPGFAACVFLPLQPENNLGFIFSFQTRVNFLAGRPVGLWQLPVSTARFRTSGCVQKGFIFSVNICVHL